MHANLTGNIYIAVARIARDVTQSCSHSLGLRASNETYFGHRRDSHKRVAAAERAIQVFDTRMSWLQTRVTLVTAAQHCSLLTVAMKTAKPHETYNPYIAPTLHTLWMSTRLVIDLEYLCRVMSLRVGASASRRWLDLKL